METTLPLLGVREAARLLGLTRQGLLKRRRQPDFPPPVELASGPVWTREQLVEYARGRAERFYERPAVERLAAETGVVSLEEAARALSVSVVRLRSLLEEWPWGPGVFDLKTNELRGVRREQLGLVARALGRALVEVA
ncbi:MAG TPA: hypothetical protein VNJ53_02940 [Gaiellaceae bacterium]|nr:hypothetical protein [Gaiellaceae bacterium]